MLTSYMFHAWQPPPSGIAREMRKVRSRYVHELALVRRAQKISGTPIGCSRSRRVVSTSGCDNRASTAGRNYLSQMHGCASQRETHARCSVAISTMCGGSCAKSLYRTQFGRTRTWVMSGQASRSRPSG